MDVNATNGMNVVGLGKDVDTCKTSFEGYIPGAVLFQI
jgi:hypothetical protein